MGIRREYNRRFPTERCSFLFDSGARFGFLPKKQFRSYPATLELSFITLKRHWLWCGIVIILLLGVFIFELIMY